MPLGLSRKPSDLSRLPERVSGMAIGFYRMPLACTEGFQNRHSGGVHLRNKDITIVILQFHIMKANNLEFLPLHSVKLTNNRNS